MKTKPKNKKAKLSYIGQFKQYYKQNPKSRKYIIIGIIVSVGLIYWFGSIAIEKIQFSKANKTLDSFVTDIQAELGQPSVIKKDKSCVETGDKYQINGLPSCSISYYLEYPVNSAAMANGYQTKIEPLISEHFTIKYKIQNVFQENKSGRYSSGIYYDLSTYAVDCSYRLEYFDPNDNSNNNKTEHKITISTGCYKPNSHWNHYPVR